MAEGEMYRIAEWVDDALRHPQDSARQRSLAQDVAALCARFPLYSDLMARIQ
jgi:glycine/serine hydroxymethyltransferase